MFFRKIRFWAVSVCLRRSVVKHCPRRPTMVGNILRLVLQLLSLGKPAIIFEKLN